MTDFVKSCILISLLFWGINSIAQQIISEADYNRKKENGQILPTDNYEIVTNASRQSHTFTPVDSSFTLAVTASDDGSSSEILLPFNFCFYGQSLNRVYINTNGNISFNSSFSSGTPFNMPFSGHKIIAPFWADVDTRERGAVYYKVLPNALIVNWEDVSYYNQNDQVGNSFQLIITNGTSELLPFGYTVGFFYDKMDWSTGDASGGLNGFGGAPAQIGINKGDGLKANLAGMFNKNNDQFYSEPDSVNGVKWLETNNIYLNPCSNINNKPSMMGQKLRDTIGVCVGDTIRPKFYFPSGDVNQQTFVSVPSGFSGFQVTNLDPGFKTELEMRVIGRVNNMGTHVVTFNVIDNGNPASYEIIEIVFQIDSLPEDPIISGDLSICADDSTQLQVQSVYDSYKWSNGERTPSILVYPGQVWVEVEYNKCVEKVSATVDGFAPTLNITGRKYLCLPDTSSLSASINMDTYSWSSGDTTQDIIVSQTGNYSVTVSQLGCESTASFLVDTLSAKSMNINRSRAVTCNGDSVILRGNEWVDSLIWSTGDTNLDIKVPNGSYSVYGAVFNSQGQMCLDSSQTTILESFFDSITLVGDTFYCGNSYAELTTTVNYEEYLWSNNNSGAYSSFVQPGAYSLVILQNQCRDTANFSIVAKPLPKPTVFGNEYICGGQNTTLTLFTNFYDSVLWNTGDTTQTISGSHGVYIVEAWQGGCKGKTEFRITDMKYGVRVKGSNLFCPDDSAFINVDPSFDSYLWNTGDTTFGTYINQSGQYYCQVNLDTCTATTDTVNSIMNDPEFVKILGDTVMCDSLPGLLFVDVFSGYAWSNGSFAAGIRYTQPGEYSVTVTDINGCTNSDTVDIKVVPGIVAEISGDSHYCNQDSVVLVASPRGSYLWSTGDSLETLKAAAGIHAVTVTASNGCRSYDNFVVSTSSPEFEVLGDTLVCDGGQAKAYVSISASDQIRWSSGGVSDTTLVPSGLNMVTVTDIFGCSSADTFELQKLPAPIARIIVDPPFGSNVGDQVNIFDNSNPNGLNIISWESNINDSLFWSKKDTTVIFENQQLAQITQVVKSDNGCSDTLSIDYLVEKIVIAPNIMTPNQDGINDYLAFPNLDVYALNRLEVFNRWGAVVYASEQYQNNWDASGLANGTYFYILSLPEGIILKGAVTVIR